MYDISKHRNPQNIVNILAMYHLPLPSNFKKDTIFSNFSPHPLVQLIGSSCSINNESSYYCGRVALLTKAALHIKYSTQIYSLCVVHIHLNWTSMFFKQNP